jgi:hypothetical protein
MLRKTLIVLTLFLLVCVGGGAVEFAPAGNDTAKQSKDAETAYKDMMEERHTYPDVEDRMALTKGYLAEYPETKHTAPLLGHVFYYQGEAQGDVPGAIAYAEGIRQKIEDPAIAREVDIKLVELYGRADMVDEMLALAGKLEADGALKFGDYWRIIEVGTKNGDWDVVRRYCEKAAPLTTAEVYREEWSQYEFTDEEATRAAKNRKGMLATKDGWAKANTDKVEAALADFVAAGGLINRNYLDIPDYDLNLHWANTLLKTGDYGGAIEKFAPDALIMGNDEALEGLKKAYVGKNGGEAGFDDYTQKLHRKIAKNVDDFELPDYEGKKHRFSDLRGEVTLLSFWFPT